jgi:hypothetical protein
MGAARVKSTPLMCAVINFKRLDMVKQGSFLANFDFVKNDLQYQATIESTNGPAEATPASNLPVPPEFGGRQGPEPTRFGDWELRGRCIDF